MPLRKNTISCVRELTRVRGYGIFPSVMEISDIAVYIAFLPAVVKFLAWLLVVRLLWFCGSYLRNKIEDM